MCRGTLLFLAGLLCFAGIGSGASAATITMLFFPLTGEVRMQNVSAVPFEFVFYSITSPSGSLNGTNGVWKSITDTYDASGNGFVDPVNNWMEISPGPGDPTVAVDELTEGVFVGTTPGVLPASRTISLGKIWNPNAAAIPDVDVEVLQSDNQPATVSVDFVLDGDYNLDDVVDEEDLAFWKTAFGFTFAPFIDGNLNGVVDAADYTVWRDHFGASLLGTAFASESADAGSAAVAVSAVVPEPSTFSLAFLAISALFGRRYWSRLSTA